MEYKELEHQTDADDPVSDWMCPVCEQEERQAWEEVLGPVYDATFGTNGRPPGASEQALK
jgi:hypothetical protein